MKRLFYYSKFKDVAENSIRIEIYKDSDTEVSATELLLSADTAQIECDADSLFSPIKVSELTLNVLTKDVLKELYTAKANEVSAKVFRNGVLFWFGYLSPNIYSSDYTDETNLLSLEFVDTLSQLDYFKYRYIDVAENKSYIRSFYDIVINILDRIDSEKVINEIYLSNSIQVSGSNDVLGKMMIQERNFFDESDEADTCKNVLSEIIKYLSMTMIQYENKYLILDYDAIKSGNNKYIKYNRATGANEVVTLPANEIIMNKNIYEANATISLGEVYNKIVVIGNNNPISNLIPDLLDDEDLENQNEDKNKVWEETKVIDETEYKLLSAFFNSKVNWHTLSPFLIGSNGEITPDNIDSVQSGSFFSKTDSYKTEDGEPSSLSWKTHLSFIGSMFVQDNTFLSLKKKSYCIFKDGYFIIDLRYYLSTNRLASSILKESDEIYYNGKYAAGFEHSKFPCRLAIDNYYFDGEKWASYTEYNLKIDRGYYKSVNGIVSGSDYKNAKWYRYKDSYGYWRYVTESMYNSLGALVTKESGGFPSTEGIHYFNNESNEMVLVTEEYYNECKLRDRFYLVHKNKVDDKVFGVQKSLTNTVSYKYNLADSGDGVAIKIPSDMVLSGDLAFELHTPSDLGTIPMYRTDKECARCNAIHISDLSLIYTTDKYTVDIFSKEKYDADIKFENVVNEDYVNDFEDLELQVNTYSEKAGSYSYVIERIDEDYDYIGSTLNLNTQARLKQEEHIITKYYNYFSSPKYIYLNTLNNVDIKPYSLLFENTLGKNFFLNKWVMNLGDNSIEVTANEV